MDVYECIKTRRSIRKFKDVEVPWDLVVRLLEAGKSAPSAGNIQNWKFIVITDKAAKQEIAEFCGNQLWIAKAPLLIVPVADVEKAKRFYGIRGERLYSAQNIAAAIENILLLAHSEGLGACWIGYMEEDKLASHLGVPEGIRPQAVIALGYPAEKAPVPPKYTLENVMYFRQFGGQGNRIRDIPQYKGEFSYKIKGAIDKTKEIAQKLNEKLVGKEDEE
jgi:nitroreductase